DDRAPNVMNPDGFGHVWRTELDNGGRAFETLRTPLGTIAFGAMDRRDGHLCVAVAFEIEVDVGLLDLNTLDKIRRGVREERTPLFGELVGGQFELFGEPKAGKGGVADTNFRRYTDGLLECCRRNAWKM